MTYLIDSDVFITAARGPYAFALCPGFWAWIDNAANRGLVASISDVEDELVGREDELSDWVKARPDFWLKPTSESVAAQQRLYQWAVASDHCNERAKREFQSGADAPLIARAQVDKRIVVTHETATTEQGRIKIPIAAAEVDVRTMSPYAMLRHEGVRFNLAKPDDQQTTLFEEL